MARFAPVQTNFTAGLLSRRLRGRDDIEAYGQGMRQALNGLILPHGGFMRRPGTVFVNEVKNQTGNNALIPFDVAVDQQYVMEVGHNYIRYYANHGQVESSPGTPLETVTTYGNDEQQDLRWAQQVDVMYLVHPNGHPYKLSRTSLTSFTWAKVAWKDGHAPMQPSNISTVTCTINNGPPLAVVFSAVPKPGGLTTADDVGRAIRWFDSVYVISTVTSTTTAELTVLHAGSDPSASSGTATLDWALGLFSNTDGPRGVIFHDGRLWYGGSRTAPDVVVASKSDDYDNFDRGISYGTTPTIGNDDMAIVRRIQGKRLQTIMWFASQAEYLIVGSTGGEFRIFSSEGGGVITPKNAVVRSSTYRGSAYIPPVQVDNQVMFVQQNQREMYELKYEVVKDNFSSRNLMLLAEDVPDSDKNGLGGIKRMTYQASPDSVIWMVHGDGSLISLTYEPDQKVTAVAPQQIANNYGRVNDIAVITNPDATAQELWFLYTLDVDGTTEQYVCYMDKQFRPALAYERATADERVRALDEAYFVDLGLKYDVPKLITAITKADPVVVTSASHGFSNGQRVKLRAPQGPEEMDRLSAVVANATTNTFELSGVDGTDWADLGEVIDPSTTNYNSPLVRAEVTTITGLDHLEGLEVDILADGMVHERRTVSGGEIELSRRASIVAVGLPYSYRGETQRFSGGAKLGTSQGRPINIDHVAIILHNSLGGKVGVGNGIDRELEALQYRDGSDHMDQSPPLFTGTKTDIAVDGGWDIDATVYFENEQPLPMTVLAVCPREQVNEG